MSKFSCPATNNSPTWGVVDVVNWKFVPESLGGGRAFIQRFKDGWVRHNRATIQSAAQEVSLPPELIGATAWIEVGGDPTFIDRAAFEVRAFDWSGPGWVDRNMTITHPPERTSFGAVSMQLRTAANTMGLDPASLSASDWRTLGACLETDVFNIQLVARHLKALVLHDFPNANTRNLTDDQIRIAGARYNRGIGLSIDAIRRNTSYGDFILKIWERVAGLLR